MDVGVKEDVEEAADAEEPCDNYRYDDKLDDNYGDNNDDHDNNDHDNDACTGDERVVIVDAVD
jgi:hypothetical protein